MKNIPTITLINELMSRTDIEWETSAHNEEVVIYTRTTIDAGQLIPMEDENA